MEILLLIGLFQTFITFIYFITKNKKQTSDKIVLIFLTVVFVQLLFEILRYIYPHSLTLTLFSKLLYPLLYGPLLYFYTIHEIYPEKKISKKYLNHSIPFFVVSMIIFIIMIPDIKNGNAVKITYKVNNEALSIFPRYNPSLRLDSSFKKQKNYKPPQEFHIRIHEVIIKLSITLSLIIYVFFIFKNLKIYERKIKNFYSYETLYISLQWLRYITLSFLLIFLYNNITSFFIPGFIRHIFLHPQMINFMSIVLFMYVFSIFSIKQPILTEIVEKKEDKESQGKYQKSGLKEEDAQKYLTEIENYMKMEKPFLNDELTISNVSYNLDIPKHYITQILNTYIGKNFYAYINHYRIEESKKYLTKEEYDKTILEIAFDSGFKSKSVFNTLFKKHTGYTPSQYKEIVNN